VIWAEYATMARWYVIRSKPRNEGTAQAHLERQGFHVYFPRIRNPARIRGRWSHRIEPLFPRYLFLQIDSGRQSLTSVRSTVGVTDVVRFGAEYATVPDEIVQELMNRADPDTGVHKLERSLFMAGMQVRVSGGPFDGLEGVFERHDGDDRVLILLDVLGRETRVRIPIDQAVPELVA
jgi:transcriptional antiterminator RfaH